MATTAFKAGGYPGQPYGSFAGKEASSGVMTFPQILYMLLELMNGNMTSPTVLRIE